MIILKILMIIGIVIAAFFVLTFCIYIFNLDMKLAAAATPLMQKIYASRKKKDQKKS